MCARQHRNSIGKCAVSYKCVVKVASAARAESIRLIRHCSKNENSKGTHLYAAILVMGAVIVIWGGIVFVLLKAVMF